MELNDANLKELAGCLQQTLSADAKERRRAEDYLLSVEQNQNYPLLLLAAVQNDQIPMHIRVSASVVFKNYVKRNWRVIDDIDNVHASDRTGIKSLIVELMLTSPEKVQKQLSEAISIIGREDFPNKWQGLLPEMVSKFQSQDFHIINGVLQTAHSIFKRYRHEFKSQELWTEIKFVLDTFALPLTELFKATMDLKVTHATNAVALKVIFSSLILICKIFYSLNFQDLPEYFEDNMAVWMEHLHTLLTDDNKLLLTDEDEEAGLLEQVKSQVCDNVALYAQKYDEEFSPHLPKFVTAVGSLLMSTGNQPKYDLLVCNAILFLVNVAERGSHKNLFEDSDTLKAICEKVIVPNMELREVDVESFEDNPEDYIRRDIEGSDVDTRRRAAVDLVRVLSKHFEAVVINNFSQFVQAMLVQYANDPKKNWKSKDVAIYLVTSLAAKGQTQKHGITQTSNLVNMADFFKDNIVPDLASSNINENPVLKADAVKFVMTFRNQVSKELLVNSVPHLINLLMAESVVVHSYAALALERIFTVRNPQGGTLLVRQDIEHCETQLLTNLFGALSLKGSSENEYVMKAIMRSFSLLSDAIVPLVGVLITQLTQKLIAVSKNPSKPHFNHYLFECICLAIRITCKSNKEAVGAFEQGLFPQFEDILKQDVQEFIPYVFQIMSLLLEMHESSVPDSYMALFGLLTVPALWERAGNIPALVRLLQAYIEKGASQIAPDKVSGILGVFQKLLASKSNDHEGFYLLNSLVQHMPEDVMRPYIKQLFVLMFQRLSSSKTTKFVKSLLVFFSLYAIRFGPSQLIQVIDSIQAKMFGMVVEKVFIPDVQKVSGQTEKKICAVGMMKLLTETADMLQGDYEQLWPIFLQSLIGLFELPLDETTPDDEHFIEIDETPGYQTAYSQLAFAGKKKNDPVASVNPKLELAKNLEKLSSQFPGKIMVLVNSGLQPEAISFLQQYIRSAGVTIS